MASTIYSGGRPVQVLMRTYFDARVLSDQHVERVQCRLLPACVDHGPELEPRVLEQLHHADLRVRVELPPLAHLRRWGGAQVVVLCVMSCVLGVGCCGLRVGCVRRAGVLMQEGCWE